MDCKRPCYSRTDVMDFLVSVRERLQVEHFTRLAGTDLGGED